MNNTLFRLTILFFATVFIYGCASQPQKPRERYSGPDSVDSFSPQQLIGKWRTRVLNDEAQESINNMELSSVIRFHENGTSIGVIKSDPLALEIELEGSWEVSDDLVSLAVTSQRNISTNPFSGIVSSVFGSYQDQMAGTVNVYEATDDRLVLVNEEEGVAMEYIRIP